jgi:hypothetical protein
MEEGMGWTDGVRAIAGDMRTRADGTAEIRRSRSWMPVCEIVWRAAERDVPKGYRVWFRNGDVGDYRLENLVLEPVGGREAGA